MLTATVWVKIYPSYAEWDFKLQLSGSKSDAKICDFTLLLKLDNPQHVIDAKNAAPFGITVLYKYDERI